MKRIILPVALALAFAGTALAQTTTPNMTTQTAAPPPPIAQHHHAANPHKEVKRLSKQLDLTPAQESQIEPIFADRDQKIAALNDNTSLADADRKQQMRAIRRDSNKQVNAILTPDQQAQMKAARKAHHHADGDQTPPPPPSA